MTIESDLKLLEKKAADVIKSADKQNKEAAANALGHMYRALGYEGASFLNAIEYMVVSGLGSHLAFTDPKAGQALTEFGKLAYQGVEAEAVNKLLAKKGIPISTWPENVGVYEQFRSGHIDPEQIAKWVIS